MQGTALEQDVGEASGPGADVDHTEAARVEAEAVEGRCQLAPAASHVERGCRVNLDSGVGRNGPPRPPGQTAVEPHEAVTNVLTRLGSRGGEPAADKLDVQPALHPPRLGLEGALGAGHLALATRIEGGGRVKGARQRLEDGFGFVMVVTASEQTHVHRRADVSRE